MLGGGRHLAVTGLATMGANLARNAARHGIPVAVHNRTGARTQRFLAEHGHEGDIVGAATLAELVAAVERPRAVLVMVKSGPAVDEVLDALVPLLADGDTVVDGGNSWFGDTERRLTTVEARGVHYLGMGVSGGEEGALLGPSLMPGGSRRGHELLRDALERMAAQVGGTPCTTYLGPGGAGHYVKMVHNGIEYADMQAIAEAYDVLRRIGGLGTDELAAVFDGWGRGELASFLVEITARILRVADRDGTGPLVDRVADRASQKGTGRLTAQEALELGVPATTVAGAVMARELSARADLRSAASGALAGPSPSPHGYHRDQLVADVHAALLATRVVAYAQGFELLVAGSREHAYDLDLAAVATIWRGGCIIRARLLEEVRVALAERPDLASLVLAPHFREVLAEAQGGWRRTVGAAVAAGVPVPAMSGALAWYDALRTERLPAHLVQAQRDLFGAHGYELVDRPGEAQHDPWEAPPR